MGLALSRAGRTETYILLSWICRELVEGVLPQVQQYQAGRGENIPDAQPVDCLLYTSMCFSHILVGAW